MHYPESPKVTPYSYITVTKIIKFWVEKIIWGSYEGYNILRNKAISFVPVEFDIFQILRLIRDYYIISNDGQDHMFELAFKNSFN